MSNLIRSKKTRVSAVLATAAVSMGILAAPASAQVEQDGLVNINISDNQVVVPVQVAANICVSDVNVLAIDAGTSGPQTCTARNDQTVTVSQNPEPEGNARGAGRVH
jgi:hypothetical protein